MKTQLSAELEIDYFLILSFVISLDLQFSNECQIQYFDNDC